MNLILTVDERHFSINGIVYLRNFLSVINGQNISIKNYYDTSYELLHANHNQISVNGTIYSTVEQTHNALVDVLYSRPVYYTGGFKNKIINGNFAINQRNYVSGTATTTNNQYTLDRWRIRSSGGSITFSNNSFDSGRTVTIPNGVFLEQPIWGNELVTGIYTVSWSGTASCTFNGSPVLNGGSVNYTYGSNPVIAFTNGTLRNVQFELGIVKTDFEYISYYQSFENCKRYFFIRNETIPVFVFYTNGSQYQLLFQAYTKLSPMIYSPTVTNIGTYVNAITSTGFLDWIGTPLFTDPANRSNRGGVLGDGSLWNINLNPASGTHSLGISCNYSLSSEL